MLGSFVVLLGHGNVPIVFSRLNVLKAQRPENEISPLEMCSDDVVQPVSE